MNRYSSVLTSTLGLEWTYLNPLYSFTVTNRSNPFCEDTTLALFEDEAYTVPWVMDTNNPTVDLETVAGVQRIKIYDSTKFSEKILYLRRRTKGLVSASVKFAFEVCGLEMAQLVYPYNATINANFSTYSGSANYEQTMLFDEYKGNFTTNSRQCLVWKFGLYEPDPTGAGHYREYTGKQAYMGSDGTTIYINTRARLNRIIYLKPLTHSNHAYLPLNVTIAPNNTDVI